MEKNQPNDAQNSGRAGWRLDAVSYGDGSNYTPEQPVKPPFPAAMMDVVPIATRKLPDSTGRPLR
jgi:hypothetical protein